MRLIGENKKYYIEIGTCNFDTLAQKFEDDDSWVGISVDAIDRYLNDLPRRRNTFYENSAIVNDDSLSEVDFYTINNENALDQAPWMKGVSSLDPNHHGLGYAFDKISVKAITFKNLIKKYNFYFQCDILKLDVEGFDADLLNNIYDFYTSDKDLKKLLPKKIFFEAKHCQHKLEPLRLKMESNYTFTYKKEWFPKKNSTLNFDVKCILNERKN